MGFDSFPINTHLVQTPLRSLPSISFINAVYESLIHRCLLEAYLFFEKENLEKSFENSWAVPSPRLWCALGRAIKTSGRQQAAPSLHNKQLCLVSIRIEY